MSRVYWDSMLFIYMLELHPVYSARVLEQLGRSYERGDKLLTSYLALGEVSAGATKSATPAKATWARSDIDGLGFEYIPFDDRAVLPFAAIRSQTRLKVADSINLACAATAGTDLFLTGDKQLLGLYVPGVQFIADFSTFTL